MGMKSDLIDLLESSARIIEYAITCIPQDRFEESPPHGDHPKSHKGFKTYFGTWSGARLLFHLVFYEHTYAIPTMEHWLGARHPQVDLIFPESDLEDVAWSQSVQDGLDKGSLIAAFRSVRSQQIKIIKKIREEEIHQEMAATGLGKISFVFVVSKTIQHTLEHGNDLMKNVLYWERALAWLDEQD